jgi:septal ring factor EnvC (AmiA/AmiB activator)
MHGMEVNMDKDRRNTVKIVSTIISLGIIAALIIGVVSVIKNVNANRNESGNIVNLNETEENVAMKTEDAEENIDESDAQDDLLEANARGRMAEKNESVEKNNDELMISDKEDTTMQEEATVPPTLSSEEVMAEAMRSFTFDESNKMAWPVLGHITLDYSMDETVLFKSLGVYKCSPGIIINSEVGTNVAAAASGVVTDVAELSETGTTVTVSIGNGYETTTGMIENVNLKKGDKVTTGQLIGTVASPSAYYIEEGPGVYFKLTQYGEPVNPDAYFVE